MKGALSSAFAGAILVGAAFAFAGNYYPPESMKIDKHGNLVMPAPDSAPTKYPPPRKRRHHDKIQSRD